MYPFKNNFRIFLKNPVALKLAFLAFCVFSLSSAASYAQDGKEILQKAYKAAHQINSISYDMVYKTKDASADTPTVYKANVILKRDNKIELTNAKYRCSVDDVLVTFNGSQYKRLINKDKKLFVVDSVYGPANWVTHSLIGSTIHDILTNDTAALKFIDGAVLKLDKKSVKLDNVDCYKVTATVDEKNAAKLSPDLTGITREYYIGKKDLVLRKFYSKVSYKENKTNETEFTITGVKLNKEYADNMFDQAKPDSYTLENYAPKARPELLKTGSEAPDFTLKNPKGENVSLRDFRGKYVVIDFWGTWCIWCKRAMPNIQKVHEQMKDKGVTVIGISCREPDKADPEKFMSKNGYTYRVLLKGDKVAEAFNVSGYPTLYIINKEGKVIYSEAGYEEGMDKKLIDVIEKDMTN